MSRRRCATSTALLLAALVCGARGNAQAPAGESQIKAAFVYNFLKFVEWPAGPLPRADEPLVVAIVGDGPTADVAADFLAGKRIGERPVVVRALKWDHSLDGVHAVFVTEDNTTRRTRILQMARSEGVLSIGEGAEFASQGGVIALLIEERKVRFDIDTNAAEAARLKISSKLLALARVVHSAANVAGARP